MAGGDCPRIRRARTRLQGGGRAGGGARGIVAATLLLAVSGCSSGSGLDPVGWWHDLAGGPVADARPPPPNANAPYPNLANVPDRPVNADAAQRAQIANGLVADRRNAQYDASLAPLPAEPARPAAPGPVPPAAGGEQASNASLAAASAPARSAPPPVRPAPVPAVRSEPLAPVSPAADAPAADTPDTPLPAVPDQPPPPPALAGVPQATSPSPPPVAPPPVPPPAPKANALVVPVAFASGSAEVPPAAATLLRALAAQRGKAAIAVTGYGEATGTAPEAQQAALPLGVSRAQAIAAILEGAGVPASAIRLSGQAAGQGGVARLVL